MANQNIRRESTDATQIKRSGIKENFLVSPTPIVPVQGMEGGVTNHSNKYASRSTGDLTGTFQDGYTQSTREGKASQKTGRGRGSDTGAR